MITVAHRLPKAGETFNSKSFTMLPGGKGANAAIALHRLSHVKPAGTDDGDAPRNMYEDSGIHEIEVRMIASIGSDSFGIQMKESLARHFVNIDGVRVQDNQTSAVAVTIIESEFGENRILVYPGANHLLEPKEFLTIESFGTERPDLVVSQLELNRETVEQLITTAKKAGIDVLLNPSPAHYLGDDVYEGLTHLILNESEAAILTGREIEELESGFNDWITITDEFLELGVQYVVVTLGGNGAFFSKQKGKGEHVAAEEVDKDDILDTSGAGCVLVDSSLCGFPCTCPYTLAFGLSLDNSTSVENASHG
jgi:ribokinase